MTRPHRVTVRFDEKELIAIEKFADEQHVIVSAALRWLVQMGLASNNRPKPPNTEQKTQASEGG